MAPVAAQAMGNRFSILLEHVTVTGRSGREIVPCLRLARVFSLRGRAMLSMPKSGFWINEGRRLCANGEMMSLPKRERRRLQEDAGADH
jgi:hypothetical protein